jgi:hypothetical protein
MLDLLQRGTKAAAKFAAAAQARAPVPTCFVNASCSVDAHVFLADVAAIIDSSIL